MELNYSYAVVTVETMDVFRDEFDVYKKVAKVAWHNGQPIAFEFKDFYKGEVVGSHVKSPYDFVTDAYQEVVWYETIEVAEELTESEYQKELDIAIAEARNRYNKHLSKAMKPMTKEECNGIVILDFVSDEIRRQEVQDFVDSLFQGI